MDKRKLQSCYLFLCASMLHFSQHMKKLIHLTKTIHANKRTHTKYFMLMNTYAYKVYVIR